MEDLVEQNHMVIQTRGFSTPLSQSSEYFPGDPAAIKAICMNQIGLNMSVASTAGCVYA